MTKMKLLLVCLGLGLSQGACAPGPAPADPSFKTDVLPIMEAHCVRCHGGGDHLNADPGLIAPRNAMSKPALAYLDSYADKMSCEGGTKTMCAGAKSVATLIPGLIDTADENTRMPPKPAVKLGDYEIEVIKNWASKPTPKP